MIPATCTHMDLRTGWLQCTHTGLASGPAVLPLPHSSQAPADHEGPPPDDIDGGSFCSKKRVLTAAGATLCGTCRQLSFSKLTCPTSPFGLLFFPEVFSVSQMFLLPANCKLRHLKLLATRCLNREASE